MDIGVYGYGMCLFFRRVNYRFLYLVGSGLYYRWIFIWLDQA